MPTKTHLMTTTTVPVLSAPVLAEARRPEPFPDALAFTILDGCRVAGISRATVYRLFDEGKLRRVKVRNRSLIDGDSLRALISGVAA